MFALSTNAPSLLTSFLALSGVRHTRSFSNRFFGEHPQKYTLYGISQMLTDYGIENQGAKIGPTQENIRQLDVPFIAQVGGDFVVVSKVTPEKVHYIQNGAKTALDLHEFCERWSGIVLLTDVTEDAIEPHYKEHRNQELLALAEKAGLAVCTGILLVWGYCSNALFRHPYLSVSLLLNFIGIYIGYLLMLKQLNFHSNYADKICSSLKKGDCNSVLQSEGAKLFGIIGWSEVGLGYFTSNVLLLVFAPFLFPYLALIYICALPYTLWSVWYQKTVVGQWCPLCLLVQVLLWCLFLTNLLGGLVQMPDFAVSDILLLAGLYAVPFISIRLMTQLLQKSNKAEALEQVANSLKSDRNVLQVLLSKQPHYPVSKATSRILFGNAEADILLTVFISTYCSHCGEMHRRLKQLLDEMGERICVQYIFSSFSAEQDISSKSLIAAYQNGSREETQMAYDKWFAASQKEKKAILEEYRNHPDDAEVNRELMLHKKWQEETRLEATPTVMLNGYILPMNYKVEDLKWL